MKLTITGMSCNHCKASVEDAIQQAGGTATVDLAAGTADIQGVSAAEAIAAIRAAGYDAAAAN
ncbi:heavy-metal-associated domain-containing protein [Paracoccus sp. 11-3]|uniref:Heavy-metal-associated domain-containing protein n=1 Tax=Paracoccus amoyensis TaxID=2760093 RepID=A0A926GHE2_9RHOB|nr:cation transporter [Paracoccus amoyensis]MBC9247062.1 heavy-metal-associated domain-containing protein [Paracoccus amoyensis]